MSNSKPLQPLYTIWGETIDKECPLNDYPRPQLRRENWQCLNGIWKYAIRDNETEPNTFDGDILVPFSPESLLSGVGKQLLPRETLWYSRYISLKKPDNDRRLLLHFGAVDQHCRIWCNGVFIGEHSGGYWPFYFDITHALEGDTAKLLIAVKDASDSGDEAWGKQREKRGQIWYTAQSGIWQTVWCEEVPASYIQSIKITPYYHQGEVEVVTLGGESEGKIRVLSEGVPVAEAPLKNSKAKIKIPDFRSWELDDPFLYTIEIAAGEDRIQSYFGMREFSVIKGRDSLPRLALNGKAVFHNGLLDQGYWSDGMYTPPCDEAMVWELKNIKQMGFNMLRKHIKIEPMRWYYHCDRLGILVWQDFVNGGGPYKSFIVQIAPWLGFHFKDTAKNYSLFARQSAAGREIFKRDMQRTVELLYNTVSLALWVPFNEGWGQFDAAEITERLRRLDPTRQIDHASGYHDQKGGDLHSYHVYFKRFRPRKDSVKGRVLALTEFGGYSLPSSGHMSSAKLFGYKIFKGQRELHAALDKLYERDVYSVMEKGLGALVYTQLSDVEDEINGLFTYDRRLVKADAVKIKEMNEKIYKLFNKYNRN